MDARRVFEGRAFVLRTGCHGRFCLRLADNYEALLRLVAAIVCRRKVASIYG